MKTNRRVPLTPLILTATLTFGPVGISAVEASAPLMECKTLRPNSEPAGITLGPDGNLWVAQKRSNMISRVTPECVVTEFPVGSAIPGDIVGSTPSHIISGPDGNLWFVEDLGNKVGKMDVNGNYVEYPLPVPGSQPHAITVGPDNNLWVGQIGTGMLARVTTNGAIDEFLLPSPAHTPHWLTTGPDGKLWFTERDAGMIGRIDPMAGNGSHDAIQNSQVHFTIPTPNSAPHGISVGPDNRLWFGEHNTNQIGVIDPRAGDLSAIQSSIREYVVPNDGPNRMVNNTVAGPDGGIWFTEQMGDRVVRLNPYSPTEMCEYKTPTGNSGPASITVGPGRQIWFTEIFASQVARVLAPANTSEPCPG